MLGVGASLLYVLTWILQLVSGSHLSSTICGLNFSFPVEQVKRETRSL